MSSQTPFIEKVHPAALSKEMTNYLALIVLEQSEEGLLHELSNLQPHAKYTIGVVERPLSEDLRHFIKKIRKIGIPPIFVQSRAPDFKCLSSDQPSYSVNLISPGSNDGNDFAAQWIAHPQTAHLSWIGYQTYLTHPELLAHLRNRYFSPLRLGSYRENFKSAEPLIRNNTLNFIDLASIRYSDAPDGDSHGPNGLYAEEICQLARYIGVSTHIDLCFIYGYPSTMGYSQMITKLLAQILWHLFESLSTGQNEDPLQPSQQVLFTTKEVYIGDQNHILQFLFSNQTGRWWIKLCIDEETPCFIPCMYEEYAMALKGELPGTWLRHYQKINLL